MGESLKRLSHEFLTPFPERVSIVCIERISAYPFADGGDARVLRHRLANVAVLAISPTDFVSGSHHAGPYRSSGSLRNGLPLEGCPPLCRKMQIDLVDNGLDTAGIYVTGKLGLYASRMHRRSTYTALPMPLVESYSKKDVERP